MKKSELKYSDELEKGRLFDTFKAINDTVDKANKIINQYKEAYDKYINAKTEKESMENHQIVYNLSSDFEDIVKEYNKRVEEFMDIPVTIAYNNTMDYIACVFDGNVSNLKSCVSYITEDSFKDAYKVKFRDAYKVIGTIGYNTIVEPESLCNMTYEQPPSRQPVNDIRQFLDGFKIRYGMFQTHEVDLENAQEIANKYKFVGEPKTLIENEIVGLQQSNSTFNEDKFLLDYVDYMQNKINMYEFAHKNNMTVMEVFNKLDNYKLVGGP